MVEMSCAKRSSVILREVFMEVFMAVQIFVVFMEVFMAVQIFVVTIFSWLNF